MADVGFDRTQRYFRQICRTVAEGSGQGFHFDGVAQRCASAVGFDIAYAGRVYAKALMHTALQGFLGRGARGGDAVCASVLVHAIAENHAVNHIAVGQRLIQAFQHHRPRPLATDEAVGSAVKHMAAPTAGDHPRLRHRGNEAPGIDHADPAGDG